MGSFWRHAFALSTLGAAALLTFLAPCMILSEGRSESGCFFASWGGVAATVVGTAVAPTLAFVAIHPRRSCGESFNLSVAAGAVFFALGLVWIVFLDLLCFVAYCQVLGWIATFAVGETVAPWSVFSWILVCSWIDAILAGFYVCVFENPLEIQGEREPTIPPPALPLPL